MSQYPAPPPPPYQPPPGNHPQSTTVLVLGIVGLVACQILSPFAWNMGNRVVREIDAAGGALGGRDLANIGRILGIVGTVLLGLSVLLILFFIVVAGIGVATSS